MTSKEALESIKNTKTNHIKNEKLGQPRKMYLVKELKKEEIETIKQDLDRLEKLEKAIEKIKTLPNCDICDENWHKGCMCLKKKIEEVLEND